MKTACLLAQSFPAEQYRHFQDTTCAFESKPRIPNRTVSTIHACDRVSTLVSGFTTEFRQFRLPDPVLRSMDLPGSTSPCACIVDAPDRLEGHGVLFGPVQGFSWVVGDGGLRMLGPRSDRLDSASLQMLFYECDHLRNGRSISAWAK